MAVYLDPFGSFVKGFTQGQATNIQRQKAQLGLTKGWLDLQAKYDFQLDPMISAPPVPSADPFQRKQQSEVADLITVKLLGVKGAKVRGRGGRDRSAPPSSDPYEALGQEALGQPLMNPETPFEADFPLGELVPPEIGTAGTLGGLPDATAPTNVPSFDTSPAPERSAPPIPQPTAATSLAMDNRPYGGALPYDNPLTDPNRKKRNMDDIQSFLGGV